MNRWKLPVAVVTTGLIILSACAPVSEPVPEPDGTIQIAATTWPVCCFAAAVTENLDGVHVAPVVDEPVSCLHDYTLTVNHMKVLEEADIIVLNGAGLEDFMDDALEAAQAEVIDCSEGVPARTLADGSTDPHIWMDPECAALMVQNIADGLKRVDPDRAEAYQSNAERAVEALEECVSQGRERLSGLACRELITFHDGFEYFSTAFDLTLLRSVEEEEGSEASAKDINELASLIRSRSLPAIFTEINGSTATAEAIARETGVSVYPLSMVMSGSEAGLDSYLEAINQNIETVWAALGGTEAHP